MSGLSPIKWYNHEMSSNFVKNHYFFMKLGKNVYFNDRKMIILPFFLFPDFSRFSDFLPKNGNFRSCLTPNSQSGHLINNSKCIDIKATTPYLSFGKRITKSLSTFIFELLTIQ